MTKRASIIIGILGILLTLLLIAFLPYYLESFINFCEKYFDADHQLDVTRIRFIKYFIIPLIILLLFVVSLLFSFNKINRIICIISKSKIYKEVQDIFFIDNISIKNISKPIFFISAIIALIMHFNLLALGTQKQEGIIEEISTFIVLIPSIVLLISLANLSKLNVTERIKKRARFILILISFLFLVYFGEEISWGQTFMGWKSNSVFSIFNFQNETNFHNFFNPLYKYLYPFVGLTSFIILFYYWFILTTPKSYILTLFLPHISLFFLAFVMAGSTFRGHSELFEEYLAFFYLFYSIRIYLCTRYPDNSIISSMQTKNQDFS